MSGYPYLETMDDRSESDDSPSLARRRFLAGIAGISTMSVAGCLVEAPESGNDEVVISPTGGPDYDPDEVPVNPDTVRIDEPFSIQFDGLSSVGSAELTVSMSDPNLVAWTTQLSYDVDGEILNLDRDEPTDPDFGPGTMRKIQRAEPASNEYRYPLRSEDEVTFTLEADGEQLGSKTVTRMLGHPSVFGSPVRDSDTIAGRVFEPPGDESVPGVVFLHGSGGHVSENLAAVLASNGFVVLGLKYFAPEAGEPLAEVPIEKVKRGAEWVLDHDRVEGTQVGVIGYSAGAELALLAGSQFDAVGAVVTVNGSGVVWPGITSDLEIAETSMWSLNGEPVSYVPLDWEEGVSQREAHEESFAEADETTIEEAKISVENIDGPVTLVSGKDDQRWNTAHLQGIAYDRLVERGHSYAFDHLVYEAAGHIITFPYYPTAHRDSGTSIPYGGSKRGYAKADAHHWPRVLDTLDAVAEE